MKPALHTALFAAYPILFLYQFNRDEVTLGQLAAPLGTSLLSAAVLLAITFGIVRDLAKASLLTTTALVLFFAYGHLHDALRGVIVAGETIGRHRYLLALWGVLALTALVLVVRAGPRLARAARALNIVGAGLVAMALITGGLNLAPTGADGNADAGITLETSGQARPRDIYFIDLDRYAGDATIREIYGYDNSEFYDYLRAKGFYVAPDSHANYVNTVLSLTSILNIEYLDVLSKERGDHWKPAHRMLRNNRVMQFLKSKGYRYSHLGSWWEPTRTNPNADRNYVSSETSEFTRTLLGTTLIGPLLGKDEKGERKLNAGAALYQFARLAEIGPRNPGGLDFVFAHMLMPHPPYVFDAEGTPLSEEAARKRGPVVGYRDQLRYTNTRVKQLIDSLLSGPPETHPIIVLASEEGPYPRRWEDEKPAAYQKAATANKTDPELQVKFRILNTFYLPGIKDPSEHLYPSISSVNTFRVILKLYFGADLPLLPDRSYVFEDFENRYTFLDITDRLGEKAGSVG